MQWAKNAKSGWELISLFKHDNNHILNSFWLKLAGIESHPVILRGLSVVSGIGSLILFYLFARRFFGVTHPALISLILFCSSYCSVLYFSEARGYEAAIFCSLAAFGYYIQVVVNVWAGWFFFGLFVC